MACTNPILIVEDADDIRQTIASLLTVEGYRVIEVDNGESALVVMRNHPGLLVLLDLMMPVMNGWELLEIRQRDSELLTAKIIVMSAATRNGDFDEKLSKFKVSGYLPKPFEIDDLYSQVQAHT